GGVQGCFQVGVGEDNCWGLAAQFQGQALELRGCSGGDGGAGGGVAGEGNQWHIRVLDQVVAGYGTGTEDQVEDAFWKAGLAEDFWPQSCGEPGVACRLQDYRVSGSDGRSQLPGFLHERNVPWGDQCGHADWLAVHVVHLAPWHAEGVVHLRDDQVSEEAEV